MSYRDRISTSRRNYGMIAEASNSPKYRDFIRAIIDGIAETADIPASELEAREYTNSEKKLKHPATPETMEKLRAMVEPQKTIQQRLDEVEALLAEIRRHL